MNFIHFCKRPECYATSGISSYFHAGMRADFGSLRLRSSQYSVIPQFFARAALIHRYRMYPLVKRKNAGAKLIFVNIELKTRASPRSGIISAEEKTSVVLGVRPNPLTIDTLARYHFVV